jgi:LCP family protein required for cell wall assembly
MPDEPERPEYRVYRSRRRLFKPREDSPSEGLQALRGEAPDAPRSPRAKPQYAVHRPRRGLRLPRPKAPGTLKRITVGRVVKWLLLAALGWTLLSLVVFLISAQVHGTSERAEDALSPAGFTLTSPNTILILGSDARTEENAEPGATVGGPSRSDSIMLLRAGGGRSARMSIPRDTVVDIPGHGRDKINAAYAIGGAGLTILTVEQYLGIEINHIVEVNFENFPEFIDAMGGITVSTGCVQSDINGGRRNGGFSLRLRAGENHLNGDQALALARTRKNNCNAAESDLTRAKRQQKIMSAIKSRLISPATFLRGPFVAWEAPKAIRSDMGGPALLGLFGAVQTGGDPETRVLGRIQPDGGVAVSEEEKAREVRAFLRG